MVCWRTRNTDEWHRLQWAQAEDEIGQQMLALFRDANALRRTYPALRRGGVSILHEVRHGCGSVAVCCHRGFVASCAAICRKVTFAQLVCEPLWVSVRLGMWADTMECFSVEACALHIARNGLVQDHVRVRFGSRWPMIT